MIVVRCRFCEWFLGADLTVAEDALTAHVLQKHPGTVWQRPLPSVAELDRLAEQRHADDDRRLAEHDSANEAAPVPSHLCRSCGASEPCEGCLVFAGTGADLFHRKVVWPV